MSTATAAPPDERPSAGRMRTAALGAGVLAAAVVAIGIDRVGGRGGLPELTALPDVARAAAACLALFSLCGYAAARTALPARLRPDAALFVLPLGAVVAALALTLLGFLGMPFPVNLGFVLLAGAASAVTARVRLGRLALRGHAGERRRVLLALALAAVIVAVAASPLFEAGAFATVLGQNGDAHLATGSAKLLQHAYPTAVAPELPIDRMPGPWRSKYPIYYDLAAVSTLAGLDPVQAFATLSALLVGLTALGFYLLARHLLGTSETAALAAMALVGLSEHTLHLALHPFFNQLWATFALPFTLLASWVFLREPGRGTLALLLGFGGVGSLAYPLLAPFTALYLAIAAVVAWRRARSEGRPLGWRAPRLPRRRRWLVLWVPLGLFLGLLALELVAAGAQKISAGIAAALPGGDLGPWSGEGLGFLELDRALGASALPLVAVPLLLAAALYALLRRPRDRALPLTVVVATLLAAAAYMRLRTGGELFVLKALSFGGVMVGALAGVGLADLAAAGGRRTRAAGAVALCLVAVTVLLGARTETHDALPHVTKEVWELREWSATLPPGASVRVDVAPYGVQQWAAYMLADRPLTATAPLTEFFPYPPIGRKADYLLVDRPGPTPPDARGAPLRSSPRFALYSMRAGVPGPDVSSRQMIDPFVPADRERPGAS